MNKLYAEAGQTTRPRLLDLFCGAGGAAVGYAQAGFEVTGVDIKVQPRYPFEFIQADVMELTPEFLAQFDAIHASPPCQDASVLHKRWPMREYPQLIEPTRQLLIALGKPYVIENVVGADLLNPAQICGTGLGLPMRRHRWFETSFPLFGVPCSHKEFPFRWLLSHHGKKVPTRFVHSYGGGQANHPVGIVRQAFEVDWMTQEELSQAIPPAYTRYIGARLLEALR